MEYTIDYFIKKFEAIPDELWIMYDFGDGDKHCALGHCDVNDNEHPNEAKALVDIFFNNKKRHTVIGVNDGTNKHYQQPTPKQRILAALYDFKKTSRAEHEIHGQR